MKMPSMELLLLKYLSKPELAEQSYIGSVPCVMWWQLFVDPF